MKAQIWDPKLKKYFPYELPDSWDTATIRDLGDEVNCAHCGRRLPYGDCYTSREIHTLIGIGYAVCESCYEQEWMREREARHEE